MTRCLPTCIQGVTLYRVSLYTKQAIIFSLNHLSRSLFLTSFVFFLFQFFRICNSRMGQLEINMAASRNDDVAKKLI